MRELALHILDIAENSLHAQADTIQITVTEKLAEDRLVISVIDNGRGMNSEMVQAVVDPFITTRTTRKVGLGIPLLKAAAEACNGRLDITSHPGKGTRIDVEFQHSHIDRMPLGDLSGTIFALCVSNPQTHWLFYYYVDQQEFRFDDLLIKEALGDISICEPTILSYLHELLENGVNEIKPTYL